MHNRLLCPDPADRDKQSIGVIDCETSFELDEDELNINHLFEIEEATGIRIEDMHEYARLSNVP